MLLQILIADDEPIERKVLEKIVTDSKLPAIIVEMSRSGTEVLQHFDRYLPDLIFMDIRMPGLNGLDVSAAIKAKHPDTTIAIITAYDEFQYAKRAIDIHVDYFILKPVDPGEVERVIQETIRKRSDMLAEQFRANISPVRVQLARQIVVLLHRHYAEPITLAWLEDKLNISHQYLGRTFKDAYNMTIMNYLTQFRMKLAVKLLADPELSIALIAEKVGIPDASYFGQIFKHELGVTPTQYRNRLLQDENAKNTARLLYDTEELPT